MKVILKQDVAGLGTKHEVANVANGYAQNFLFPRGLAEQATEAKVEHAEQVARERQERIEEKQQALRTALEKLGGEPLTIRATANEKGNLFEAVSAETVAQHLVDVVDADVVADSVIIGEPLKELGEHTIQVALGTEKVDISVSIVAK